MRQSVIVTANRWTAVLAWLILVSYSSLIFYFSSQSELPHLPFPVFSGFDKIVHACEFGLLSLLLYWAIGSSFQKFSLRERSILSGVISVLYGISDEIHQSFVPMRHGDLFDVLADAAGAMCALIAVRIMYVSRRNRRFRVWFWR